MSSDRTDDQLLTANDRKEKLSLAYVAAVAAKAGYATAVPDPDRDSIDLFITAGGQSMRPTIGVQLKATSSAKWKDEKLAFVLKRKNYDDLRASRFCPAILVVLELPTEEKDWLRCTEDALTLRRCAWWMFLWGFPQIETESKTIYVPRSQTFSPESLANLMERARGGSL